MAVQGDRRAGPSLAAFNYESRWGQLALKTTYKGIMQEESLAVLPPCCCPSPMGEPPRLSMQHFLGQVCTPTAALSMSSQQPSATMSDVFT